MRPRVSVIIPTYNRAAKVLCAIQSVLHQSEPNFEVIVVDDASPDKTQEILSTVKDPRLKVIRHDRNQHVSAARNTGVAAAQSDKIAFLDDDDQFLPRKLERQLHFMEHVAPQYPASTTDYIIRSEKGCSAFRPSQFVNPTNALICDMGVLPSALMVDRKVYEKTGGYDAKLNILEDCEWFLRYLKHHRAGFVPEMLTLYNGFHPQTRDDGTHARQYILEKHGVDLNATSNRRFVAGVHWAAARSELLINRNLSKGLKEATEAFRLAPLTMVRRASSFLIRRATERAPLTTFIQRPDVKNHCDVRALMELIGTSA